MRMGNAKGRECKGTGKIRADQQKEKTRKKKRG
jgi:hypothetical protein